MPLLVIMRGLPGAGKSTRARNMYGVLTPAAFAGPKCEAVVCSQDHYFMDWSTGEYNFNGALIERAAEKCLRQLETQLKRQTPLVVLDNTNSRHWEFADALTMARDNAYDYEFVDIFDGDLTDEELAARNTHGVPVDVIAKMRERWEA